MQEKDFLLQKSAELTFTIITIMLNTINGQKKSTPSQKKKCFLII